jgi:mono/diheme cytochrome c family protein
MNAPDETLFVPCRSGRNDPPPPRLTKDGGAKQAPRMLCRRPQRLRYRTWRQSIHVTLFMSVRSPIARARRRHFLPAFAFCGATLLAAGPAAAAKGDYTAPQANAGRQVYSQHCAQCHGGKMEGEAGPPLKGKPFASDLSYSQMSAKQLFDFIKQHMPKNAPGSLSDKQYRRVFAYILAQNGYPNGSQPLTDQSVKGVDLLPYPGGGKQSTPGNSSQ